MRAQRGSATVKSPIKDTPKEDKPPNKGQLYKMTTKDIMAWCQMCPLLRGFTVMRVNEQMRAHTHIHRSCAFHNFRGFTVLHTLTVPGALRLGQVGYQSGKPEWD